ncbi:hypothetical protein Lal_00037354 [Lupinus albus]|nr:hypothetical protein Lal_00037354 [Lupinus albus]
MRISDAFNTILKFGVLHTHPRHNIPILEGTISCKLFLDIPFTRVVDVGTMHNTPNAMLHNARIPPNPVKVPIDITIEDDALLPILLDEDIITSRGSIGTFVAWPVHLVNVVPTKEKVIAEHSATSPPRVEHASKKTEVVKSKLKENKHGLSHQIKNCQGRGSRPSERWLSELAYSHLGDAPSLEREDQSLKSKKSWTPYLSEKSLLERESKSLKPKIEPQT